MSLDPARPRWPLFALAAIVVVTIGWWAAALWPLPPATPDWVVRARAACFGVTESGLPNSGGWILLIGTPLSMVAALAIIAGAELREALTSFRRTRGGAWILAGSALMLLLLSAAAGLRVAAVGGYTAGLGPRQAIASATAEPRRLSREAPPLRLVDQHGATVELESFQGRPVLVTFAYGKCGTVCPVIVRSTLAARDALAELEPVVLIVTLDPWRDPPARLPHIATSWELSGDARVLSGEIADVETTLDRWDVERSRDLRTGEIVHPSLVYVIDRSGRIAYVVTGNAEQIASAVRRL